MKNLLLTYTDSKTSKVIKDEELYDKKGAKKRIKELRKKKIAVLGSIICYIEKGI